jgi:Domain of unknown function (DUF6532)
LAYFFSAEQLVQIKQRSSQVLGEVKCHARPVTIGHYKLDARDDHEEIVALVRDLTQNNSILYKVCPALSWIGNNSAAYRTMKLALDS